MGALKTVTRGIRDKRLSDDHAFAEYYFLKSLLVRNEGHGLHHGPERQEKIIISMTTIPARLYDIATTVESLLHQTLKPDAIVLWLDESKVAADSLPISLFNQTQRGLSVRLCKDVGPHTKLIPALQAYPNDVVITVDDDVLYPFDLVERLYGHYRIGGSKIYCTRARRITGRPGNNFDYVKDWPNIKNEAEGNDVLPLGVGGVLYPPGVFDAEVFNGEMLTKLAPKADDIWFKAMALRRRVPSKRVALSPRNFPLRPFSQTVGLRQFNLTGGNERQVRACFDYYGLWPILKEAFPLT